VEAAQRRSRGADKTEAEPGTTAPAVPFELRRWLREHPLRDSRFSFFIFILIPVQTLFAHQWLTLPQYVQRAFEPWVSRNMEFFVNLNPLLIFVLTPILAALTIKQDVYRIMIIGTLIMAVPTFLLAFGPYVGPLLTYIVLMSVGEALWQPRFLQLAAEIAPEGKTGQYMGIAQFPWFLTKLLTSLYSGTLLARHVPETGPQSSESLWLLYGAIAMITPISLFLARKWMSGKLKTSGVGGYSN
jgi:MFS family permease